MDTNYKDLSDKIGRVEITMTEKLGEVLGSVREMSATMRAAVEQMHNVREDVEKIKELATRAKDSTDSAHKRIDALRPISEANLVERTKETEAKLKTIAEADLIRRTNELEQTVKWVAKTSIGAIILGLIGLLIKFGGGQ